MKSSFYLLFITALFGSCTSEEAINSAETETKKEEPIADIEPEISYPIKITQRNIKETYGENGRVYHKYDSVEITQLSDSSYYYQYFRNGTPHPKTIDTLFLPDPIPDMQDTSKHAKLQRISFFNPFSGPGNREVLHTVELKGKVYKIIERNSSCCPIWEPRGHVHQGSKSYFSLDFGMLGSFMIRESSTSKTLCRADWNQELVDSLIQQLPLRYDDLSQSPILIESN